MITSLGVGSGLDLQRLVDQLVAAERAPAEQRLNIREATLQAELSAFGSLKSALSSVVDAAAKLKELAPGKSAAVSGGLEAIAASASDSAALGSYSINVGQLASAHALATGVFASGDTVIGSGTLTIDFGTNDYDPDTDSYSSFTPNASRPAVDIEIGPGGQSLNQIRDAINEADIGVTASVVSDSSGARLVFASQTTGENNSIRIVTDDDDGNDRNTSGLSQLRFDEVRTRMEQTVAAADASFTVNGLTLTNSANEGIEAVTGLTIDLLSVSTSDAIVKVANRESAVTTAFNEFIDAYNALIDITSEVGSFDPESGASGTLFGDTALRSLLQSVRTGLSGSSIVTDSRVDTFAEMGLDVIEGKLTLDGDRLSSFIDSGFDEAVEAIQNAAGVYADRLDAFDDENDGLLQVRTDGIQNRLEDIADDRLGLLKRIESVEARLTRRFAGLDTLLANLQSTSDFITNQLANLNVRNNKS